MKLPLLEASLDEVIDLFLFTQVTGKMIVAIEGLYQDIVFIYRHIVPDKGQRTSTHIFEYLHLLLGGDHHLIFLRLTRAPEAADRPTLYSYHSFFSF